MERARAWLPRALGALAFALYAWAAPPGPYWLDSPELTAAAVRLGSPHATGFPLYCLLAKAASMVPVGEIAWRVNLLSAACAALAVLWVTRLVLEVRRGDAAALAGAACAGLTLAVFLTFFRQGTVAEVYAPTGAALALTLLLFARVARGAGAPEGLLLAAVFGLGLGLHTSYRLLAPLPVAALFWVRLRRGARWPLVAPALALLIGAALHLYLPVRSATGRTAGVDWGHPRTAAAFSDHVTAAQIRESFEGEIFSTQPLVVAENARAFGAEIADQLGPICLLAALAGLLCLAGSRPGRWVLGALLVVIVFDGVYAFWVHPMGIEDLQSGVPLGLGVCAAAGIGVAWFCRYLGRAAPYGGAALAVLVALQPALVSAGAIPAGAGSELPRRWAERGLDQVPARGVALTQSDNTSSGLLYLTEGEGARPDVAVLARQQLRDTPRTAHVLSASGSGLVELEPSRPLRSILRGRRPILWEMGTDGVPRGARLVHGVPLARLLSARAAEAALAERDDIGSSAAALAALFDGPGGADWVARRAHAHALTNLGRAAVVRALPSEGDPELFRAKLERAARLFERAVEIRPRHAAALVNRGVVDSYLDDFERALAWTEAALAIEPNRIRALVNAARYSAALGDLDRARRHVDRALELEPGHRVARALAARLGE